MHIFDIIQDIIKDTYFKFNNLFTNCKEKNTMVRFHYDKNEDLYDKLKPAGQLLIVNKIYDDLNELKGSKGTFYIKREIYIIDEENTITSFPVLNDTFIFSTTDLKLYYQTEDDFILLTNKVSYDVISDVECKTPIVSADSFIGKVGLEVELRVQTSELEKDGDEEVKPKFSQYKVLEDNKTVYNSGSIKYTTYNEIAVDKYSTEYEVLVRHYDETSGWSPWGSVKLTTRDIPIPNGVINSDELPNPLYAGKTYTFNLTGVSVEDGSDIIYNISGLDSNTTIQKVGKRDVSGKADDILAFRSVNRESVSFNVDSVSERFGTEGPSVTITRDMVLYVPHGTIAHSIPNELYAGQSYSFYISGASIEDNSGVYYKITDIIGNNILFTKTDKIQGGVNLIITSSYSGEFSFTVTAVSTTWGTEGEPQTFSNTFNLYEPEGTIQCNLQNELYAGQTYTFRLSGISIPDNSGITYRIENISDNITINKTENIQNNESLTFTSSDDGDKFFTVVAVSTRWGTESEPVTFEKNVKLYVPYGTLRCTLQNDLYAGQIYSFVVSGAAITDNSGVHYKIIHISDGVTISKIDNIEANEEITFTSSNDGNKQFRIVAVSTKWGTEGSTLLVNKAVNLYYPEGLLSCSLPIILYAGQVYPFSFSGYSIQDNSGVHYNLSDISPNVTLSKTTEIENDEEITFMTMHSGTKIFTVTPVSTQWGTESQSTIISRAVSLYSPTNTISCSLTNNEVLINTNYPITISGSTIPDESEIKYRITGISNGISFSKTEDISENEEITFKSSVQGNVSFTMVAVSSQWNTESAGVTITRNVKAYSPTGSIYCSLATGLLKNTKYTFYLDGVEIEDNSGIAYTITNVVGGTISKTANIANKESLTITTGASGTVSFKISSVSSKYNIAGPTANFSATIYQYVPTGTIYCSLVDTVAYNKTYDFFINGVSIGDNSGITYSISSISSDVTISKTSGILNNETVKFTSKTTGVKTFIITAYSTKYGMAGATAKITTNVLTALQTISYTANGYGGTYDGKYHAASVTVNTSGCTIRYGTTIGNYNLTSMPSYNTQGNHIVYFKITKSGYETVEDNVSCIIRNLSNMLVNDPASGNFNIYSTTTSGELIKTTFANAGYYGRVKVDGTQYTMNAKTYTPVSGVTFTRSVYANVAKQISIDYTIKNTSSVSHTVGVSVDSDVMIYNNDYAPIYSTNNGFYMTDGTYYFEFLLINYSNVVNVDGWYFCRYSIRTNYSWVTKRLEGSLTNTDSGMTFNWQNRVVGAGKSITLRAILDMY